jgi:hypothetical protein
MTVTVEDFIKACREAGVEKVHFMEQSNVSVYIPNGNLIVWFNPETYSKIDKVLRKAAPSMEPSKPSLD